TKRITWTNGNNANQRRNDRASVFPSDCTANRLSTAHSAEKNTGRVNRACKLQVDDLVTSLSVQHTFHDVKFILHSKLPYAGSGPANARTSRCGPLPYTDRAGTSPPSHRRWWG